MSILSEVYWPKCPKHHTWMQPTLRPRQWRCNVPVLGGSSGPDGRTSTCPETARYLWWSFLNRRVFATLEMTGRLRHYYCPICESFFWLDLTTAETGYGPPYFRLCNTCLRTGIEHSLRYANCAQCAGTVEFFGAGQTIFGVEAGSTYCRRCGKFLCPKCAAQHPCAAEEP